jgi:hypothetical protein
MLRQRRVDAPLLQPLLGDDATGGAASMVPAASRLWEAVGPLCTLIGAGSRAATPRCAPRHAARAVRTYNAARRDTC